MEMRKRKISSIAVMLMLIISTLMTGVISVSADETVAAGTQYTESTTESVAGNQQPIEIIGEGTVATLNFEGVTIESADSPIIVRKGATLNLNLSGSNVLASTTAGAGIYVEDGATLNLDGTGNLVVTGKGGAGIGGNRENGSFCSNFGDITVQGITLTTKGLAGRGIGTGDNNGNDHLYNTDYIETKGTITINSGYINTNGLGGGSHKDGCTLTINDGTVVSEGTIGSSLGSSSSFQKQNPGYVNSKTGGSNPYTGGTIVINGGNITATTGVGKDSAGIGGAMYCDSGNITINGGIINAVGNFRGAGIGGGYMGDGNNITIKGGSVYAEGGNAYETKNGVTEARGAAGIGGGGIGRISGLDKSFGGNAGNIVISGGTVTAKAGYKAAGIGTGSTNQYAWNSAYPDLTESQAKAHSSITITGGIFNVFADGVKNAIDYDYCNTSITNAALVSGRLVKEFGNEVDQNGLVEGAENDITLLNGNVAEKTVKLPTVITQIGTFANRAFAVTVANTSTYFITSDRTENMLEGYQGGNTYVNTPWIYHDNIRLEEGQPQKNLKDFTVTYTDGVDGSVVFEDQQYTVKEDSNTPEFDGTPIREGYTFTGWSPEVADTVTGDIIYVAQWERNPVNPINPPVDPPVNPINPVVPVNNPIVRANAPTNGNAIIAQQQNITRDAAPEAAGEQTLKKGSAAKAGNGAWALINLICAIFTVLMIGILAFSKKKKYEFELEEDEEGLSNIENGDRAEDKKLRRKFKFGFIVQVLVGIVSVIAFILTEDITLSMILEDKWTMWMVVLAIASIVTYVVIGKRKDDDEEEPAYQS